MSIQRKLLVSLGVAFAIATAALAQPSVAFSLQNQDGGQQQGEQQPPAQGACRGFGRGGPMDGRGVIGKITSIGKDSIEVTRPDGSAATIKLSEQTQFRKDRRPAKLRDFKVGEYIFVRGDESADHTYAAPVVAGRIGGGAQGDRLFSNGFRGELGKDLVVDEVTSIDAPKLTVLRPDRVFRSVVERRERESPGSPRRHGTCFIRADRLPWPDIPCTCSRACFLYGNSQRE